MNKKEIDACLGWNIRSGKGFYYKGKKYDGVAYLDDCIEIHVCWDINSIVYINYEDIEKIENVRMENKLQKVIFTK